MLPPVLAIIYLFFFFTLQVVEGDPTKVMRVQYVWVLCRDMVELNPQAAWRLLDLSAQSSEQLV